MSTFKTKGPSITKTSPTNKFLVKDSPNTKIESIDPKIGINSLYMPISFAE